jgi:hypothetical protein
VRVFIGFSILIYLAACDKNECIRHKSIINIGACDLHGYCGVLFDDGSTNEGYSNFSYHPVVGKKVCAQYGRKK